jgi:hypothetical protein
LFSTTEKIYAQPNPDKPEITKNKSQITNKIHHKKAKKEAHDQAYEKGYEAGKKSQQRERVVNYAKSGRQEKVRIR